MTNTFAVLHQIPVAPGGSKSGPYVGLAALGLWVCCHGPPVLHSSQFSDEKKRTSRFKPINHGPWEICSFPPECYNTLLLWLQPSAPALLGFSITLTEAYFHNTFSGSTYLSTSRIPTPLLPLREIYFLYIIRCVGKLYGDVISGFSHNTYWEVSLDFFRKSQSLGGDHTVYHTPHCTSLYVSDFSFMLQGRDREKFEKVYSNNTHSENWLLLWNKIKWIVIMFSIWKSL